MKYLLPLILLASVSASGQLSTFRKIKLRPNAQYSKTKKTTIVYPVIVTTNKQADRRMNALVMKEMFELENKRQNVHEVLMENINDGLTDLSYHVTYNRNGLLSFEISSSGC